MEQKEQEKSFAHLKHKYFLLLHKRAFISVSLPCHGCAQTYYKSVGMSSWVVLSRIWKTETQLKKWYSPAGGVLCWQKEAGDSVKEGDVIATLYTRKESMELESPYAGVILLKNPIHAPQERQELAKFLVE